MAEGAAGRGRVGDGRGGRGAGARAPDAAACDAGHKPHCAWGGAPVAARARRLRVCLTAAASYLSYQKTEMGAGGSVPAPANAAPTSMATPQKAKPSRAAAVRQSLATIGRILREGLQVHQA